MQKKSNLVKSRLDTFESLNKPPQPQPLIKFNRQSSSENSRVRLTIEKFNGYRSSDESLIKSELSAGRSNRRYHTKKKENFVTLEPSLSYEEIGGNDNETGSTSPTIHELNTQFVTTEKNVSEQSPDNEFLMLLRGSSEAEVNELIRKSITDIPSIIDSRYKPIIEELLNTEEKYMESLKSAMKHYAPLFEDKNIPIALREHKYATINLIKKIYIFHQEKFYPALKECKGDIRKISDIFRYFIGNGYFDIYIQYALNKTMTDKYFDEFTDIFLNRQAKTDDKLGISSYLIHPLQRLAKYPLLLESILKEMIKTSSPSVEVRITAVICSIANEEVKKVLNLLNDVLELKNIEFEDPENINLLHQGNFIKTDEFLINSSYDQRKYRGKVYLFENCLIFTKLKKNKYIYRSHLHPKSISIRLHKTKKSIYLTDTRTSVAMILTQTEKLEIINDWVDSIVKIISKFDPNNNGRTKKIRHIFEELLTTEEDYIQSLIAVRNYTFIDFEQIKNDPSFKMQKNSLEIYEHINDIAQFHLRIFSVAIKHCKNDPGALANRFHEHIDNGDFYIYIKYAINKCNFEPYVKEHLDLFKMMEKKGDDKYQITKILNMPFERLSTYRLLLNEMCEEIMQLNNTEMKNELAAFCTAEKKINKIIDAVNEAVWLNEIEYDDKNSVINIAEQGKFHKSGEFSIFDIINLRQYNGRIFLFSESLIYTEYGEDKQKLIYQGRISCSDMIIKCSNENGNKVYVVSDISKDKEIEIINFSATDGEIANSCEILRVFSGIQELNWQNVKNLKSLFEINEVKELCANLLKSELGYIEILQKCSKNYLNTDNRKKESNPVIFHLLQKISIYHQKYFHPLLQSCGSDIGRLAEIFVEMIKCNNFYNYVKYSMNKPNFDLFLKSNKEKFLEIKNESGDNFGIFNISMKPIHRLPYYRQFFRNVLKEFSKLKTSNEHLDREVEKCKLAEKSLSNIIDLAIKSLRISDIEFVKKSINLQMQGKFLNCGEFYITDKDRKYLGKIFLFEKIVLLTEYNKQKRKFICPRFFMCTTIEVKQPEYFDNNKHFSLTDGIIEINIFNAETNTDDWVDLFRGVIGKTKKNSNELKRNEIVRAFKTEYTYDQIDLNTIGDRSTI